MLEKPYLRIAVTDECMMNCIYCRPRGAEPSGRNMSPEEVRLLVIASGARKVRLTGGEPLLRPDLEEIVEGVARAAPQVVLTTRGVGLAGRAGSLRRAGLARINISIDSFSPATYARVTGSSALPEALEGLRAAVRAGVEVRINCVVVRGLNDGELREIRERAEEEGATVRFIERMNSTGEPDEREIVELVSPEGAAPGGRNSAARTYVPRGGGEPFGVIAARTSPPCPSCDRLRVDARGMLHACLYEEEGEDVVALLRARDRGGLRRAFERAFSRKRGRPLGERTARMWIVGG